MIPRNGESSDLKEKRKCGKNVKVLVQFLTGPLEHPISFIHTPLIECLVLVGASLFFPRSPIGLVQSRRRARA